MRFLPRRWSDFLPRRCPARKSPDSPPGLREHLYCLYYNILFFFCIEENQKKCTFRRRSARISRYHFYLRSKSESGKRIRRHRPRCNKVKQIAGSPIENADGRVPYRPVRLLKICRAARVSYDDAPLSVGRRFSQDTKSGLYFVSPVFTLTYHVPSRFTQTSSASHFVPSGIDPCKER